MGTDIQSHQKTLKTRPRRDTDVVLEERGYTGKLVRGYYCTLWACTVKEIISEINVT